MSCTKKRQSWSTITNEFWNVPIWSFAIHLRLWVWQQIWHFLAKNILYIWTNFFSTVWNIIFQSLSQILLALVPLSKWHDYIESWVSDCFITSSQFHWFENFIYFICKLNCLKWNLDEMKMKLSNYGIWLPIQCNNTLNAPRSHISCTVCNFVC